MRQLRREEVRVSLNELIAITVTLTFNLFETSSRFERLDSNKLKTFRRHIKRFIYRRGHNNQLSSSP